MGFELYGRSQKLHISHYYWHRLLELAYTNGWKPRGIIRPYLPSDFLDRSSKSGSHGSQEVDLHPNSECTLNDSQGDTSAKQFDIYKYFAGNELVRALESAFPEPVGPYMDYLSNDYHKVSAEDAKAIADALENALPNIADSEAVKKVIRFCRCGEFIIG
jgi:hypothetical protein